MQLAQCDFGDLVYTVNKRRVEISTTGGIPVPHLLLLSKVVFQMHSKPCLCIFRGGVVIFFPHLMIKEVYDGIVIELNHP